MKIDKASGTDKVSPRLLKEAKNEIVKPLSIIFNKSLTLGKVPRKWKVANVTLIYKKDIISHPGNYRLNSLTSVVGKLMESMIKDKAVEYSEKDDIIADSQHGFRNERSCLAKLLDFFNDVLKMFNNIRIVDIIYLDIQKAFDRIPHKRFISKVKAHGITGNLCKWVENWLTDRKQRVVFNGKVSDSMY